MQTKKKKSFPHSKYHKELKKFQGNLRRKIKALFFNHPAYPTKKEGKVETLKVTNKDEKMKSYFARERKLEKVYERRAR